MIARLLVLLLLAGCVDLNGLPAGDAWHETLEHAPLPAVWVQMPRGMGGAACGRYLDGRAVATCAIYDYTEHVCWIYSEYSRSDAPRWLIEHEEEHCRGRDHDRV